MHYHPTDLHHHHPENKVHFAHQFMLSHAVYEQGIPQNHLIQYVTKPLFNKQKTRSFIFRKAQFVYGVSLRTQA